MSAPAQGSMHNLVVCGADDALALADAAIFSDFMGFSRTLQDLNPNISGTFLSCFPLDDHFLELENRNPTVSDIKFGQFGSQRAPLYTYSASQHKLRSGMWYRECSAAEILAEVTKWLHEKASSTIPGDVVNIFICCHGTSDGVICFGNKRMSNDELSALLRNFGFGVEVNAVVSHCYSGQLPQAIASDSFQPRERFVAAACGPLEKHLSDRRSTSGRYRNMSFSQPVVECLQTPSMTLRDFNQRLRQFMQNTSHPTSYTYHLTPEKNEAIAQVSDLMIRNYADLRYLSTHRPHRRQAWPSLDLVTRNQIRRADLACQNRVVTVVDNNVSACLNPNEDPPFEWPADSLIAGMILETSKPQYDTALKLLYLRGCFQKEVLQVLRALQEERFISNDSFKEPINFTDADGNVTRASGRLKTFTQWGDRLVEDLGRDHLFDQPIVWLATLIVRSRCDYESLFAFLRVTGLLGEVSQRSMDNQEVCLGLIIEHDPNAGAKHGHPMYGFRLPSGIAAEDVNGALNACLEEFRKVEALFNECFGLEAAPRSDSDDTARV